MSTNDLIWYEFIDAKYKDQYLCYYLSRQKRIRKSFKIATIVLSAGGVFTAFKEFQIPTIIISAVVGIVQVLTSVESLLIHSEDGIESISSLRILLYNRANELEDLFRKFYNDEIDSTVAEMQLFSLRKSAEEIEKLDNKINTADIKLLRDKTENYVNSYLKRTYNV